MQNFSYEVLIKCTARIRDANAGKNALLQDWDEAAEENLTTEGTEEHKGHA